METGIKLLERYNLFVDHKRGKRFGQHFLFDRRILERIARCAIPLSEGGIVVEVGPGPCGLTSAIMEICKPVKLYCIEKDPTFEALHSDFAAGYENRLEFIYGDALDIKPQSLSPNKKITILSNLPYNIGTKLLTNWILDPEGIDKMILMFQKEVATRICATVGTKTYGRLSILSQLQCKVENVFDIPNRAFYPIPKVKSTVMKITPRKTVVTEDGLERLQKLTAMCFQKRRKMLHNILKNRYTNDSAIEALSVCGINPKCRPEALDPAQYQRLAASLPE
ncbi:MAG: 16S rRNA (adenine(1518)-N(6)/adenine(1519)-N(6))-dimethyltransferase RsmA [Holosporales bacterium]|jgi:16S rRNA (adenine1518-N6/adenine1519-N6)-dimethyltransferase|nr:16S rRNA (adenine(1518)-N(6)/adenine(1519)-N(6))-dimethyltransferase RsmA [Holosporales bacterium]